MYPLIRDFFFVIWGIFCLLLVKGIIKPSEKKNAQIDLTKRNRLWTKIAYISISIGIILIIKDFVFKK